MLLMYGFSYGININLRLLFLTLGSFKSFGLSFLYIWICLLDELKHWLLLQSDRLLQVFEELPILFLFDNFSLVFLDYTSFKLFDMLGVIIESAFEIWHLVRNQTKAIFKLLLHEFDMGLHHVGKEFSFDYRLLGRLNLRGRMLLGWKDTEVLWREGLRGRWSLRWESTNRRGWFALLSTLIAAKVNDYVFLATVNLILHQVLVHRGYSWAWHSSVTLGLSRVKWVRENLLLWLDHTHGFSVIFRHALVTLC